LPRAETELGYAGAMAGESAEFHAVECALRLAQYDVAGAETAGRRAIELDPQYIFGWTWLSLTLSGMGRFEEALAMAQSAVPVDPLSSMPPSICAWAYNAGRRFEDAEPPLRHALELNPNHGLALWQLGISLMGQGRPAEAVSVLERSHKGYSDGQTLVHGLLAWAKAVAGRRDEALRHLDELRDLAKHRYVPRYSVCWALGALGDIETALDELERSVEERDAYLMYPLFPGNDPLRGEPRFQKVLERIGLGWAIGR